MNKKQTVYAFIDSQNLNLGVGNSLIQGKKKYTGWKLDYRKFRLYLKNKYGVEKAYLFIGNKPGNENLYNTLRLQGYDVVLKPTLPYKENGKMNTKGNVDAELVLYASAIVYGDYDKAIVISGDGDFLCLVEYLEDNNKLAKILTPNFKYSSLLNKFANKIQIVGDLQNKLEYKKKIVKK